MDKRAVLRLAARAGHAQTLIDGYYALGEDPYDLEVDDRIREYELPAGRREGWVLMPVTEGGLHLNSFIFAVLAHGFRTRGYEPLFVLCHDDLELCIRKHRFPDDASTCAQCIHAGTTFLDEFGLEYVTLSELLPSYDPPTLEEGRGQSTYRGIDVGTYARASTRKFLQKFTIDYEDEYERSVYRRMLRSSLHLVDAANAALDLNEFEAVLAHQPAYLYGGIYLDVAVQRGTPGVSVGRGWEDQKLLFGYASNRNAMPQFEDRAFVRSELDRPLTPSERERVDEIMATRRDGSGMLIDYVGSARDSVSMEEQTHAVGLFTNLMWDASLESATPLFTNPYTWILSTIEYLAGGEDVELVVKTHPAEAVIGTSRGVMSFIESNYDTLPGNVRLLPPDTDVNPYELIEELDVGLVWNSTIGLEMAYYGIPVVLAGDTHYRGLGFTEDPSNVREYFRLLDSPGELSMDDKKHDRATRYAHFLFTRKSVDFPYYESNPDDLGGQGVPVRHEEIANDSILDFVVDAVVEGEPVVIPKELATTKAA